MDENGLLPGEFELTDADYGDPTIRSPLLPYYAAGGNKRGFGMFLGKIFIKDNGWILLKKLVIRINDMVGSTDHCWIYDESVAKKYRKGDYICFFARVYAYHRNPEKHKGKTSCDLSLKELTGVRKIGRNAYILMGGIESE